jgi:hypothetical protein
MAFVATWSASELRSSSMIDTVAILLDAGALTSSETCVNARVRVGISYTLGDVGLKEG